MTYYIKGGSRYNEANPTVWTVLVLGGYNEGTYYEDADWKQIDYSSIVQNDDPFWLMGSVSGGAKEFELGLYNGYRFKCTTSGCYYWDGDSFESLDALGDDMGDHTASEDLKMAGWDITSTGALNIEPNGALKVYPASDGFYVYENGGTVDYIQIYHNGSNGFIQTNAGDMYFTDTIHIRSGKSLYIYDGDNSDSVRIYHGGSNAAYTTTTGVHYFQQDIELRTGSDLYVRDSSNADYVRIYHNGTNGYISTAGTGGGDLYLEPAGDVRSSKKIYNAVYNDYADYWKADVGVPRKPGYCYSLNKEGVRITNKRADKACLGICSDTYGMAVGPSHRAIPISVGGFLLAHVDKEYDTGDLLVPNAKGILTLATKEEIIMQKCVAKYMYKETKIKTRGVNVKDRHWVKVV